MWSDRWRDHRNLALFAALALVLAAAISGFDAGWSSWSAQRAGAERGAAACTPTAARALRANSAEGGFALVRNDVVIQRLCAAGTFAFSVTPTADDGVPHLVVASGTSTLWEDDVREPRRVRVPIEEPGWVSVAFSNNVAGSGRERMVWISEIAFDPSQ